MLNHFEKHNILTSLNHGFRSGYSCETQLLITIDDLMQNYNSGIQTDVAILDFSKAFDTVPHDKLIGKLRSYGIQGPLLAWLSHFLSDRTMRVICEGKQSSDAKVGSGVPQGTVLGPLLFLCHINDLPERVKSTVRLFADDCLLYRQIRNESDKAALQDDLLSLEKWAEEWGMRFNAKKCYIMHISPKRNKHTHMYSLGGHILECVKDNPYLGLQISEDLKWNKHIRLTANKAAVALGMLRRNLKFLPKTYKSTAYISMVRSILEYGSIVWDPFLKQDIQCLERVQKRAARFIVSDYRTQSQGFMTRTLKDIGLPPLQQRRLYNRLSFFYKITNGLVPAIQQDAHLTPLDNKRRIRPTQYTGYDSKNPIVKRSRNNSKCFTNIDSKCSQYKNSFFSKNCSRLEYTG